MTTTCKSCGREVSVRQDGRLRLHRHERAGCAGSGTNATSTTPTSYPVTLDAMDADLVAMLLERMVLDVLEPNDRGNDELRADVARIVAELKAAVIAGPVSA
jgi:hypothetical protein